MNILLYRRVGVSAMLNESGNVDVAVDVIDLILADSAFPVSLGRPKEEIGFRAVGSRDIQKKPE